MLEQRSPQTRNSGCESATLPAAEEQRVLEQRLPAEEWLSWSFPASKDLVTAPRVDPSCVVALCWRVVGRHAIRPFSVGGQGRLVRRGRLVLAVGSKVDGPSLSLHSEGGEAAIETSMPRPALGSCLLPSSGACWRSWGAARRCFRALCYPTGNAVGGVGRVWTPEPTQWRRGGWRVCSACLEHWEHLLTLGPTVRLHLYLDSSGSLL